MIQGTKSKFFTDVKSPVMAGMEFGSTNYKIKKIGYDIIRIYYDSIEKDLTIGQERIKRVLLK